MIGYSVGTRRFVTYTNLDPGEYIFQVKATNSDGVWSKTATHLLLLSLHLSGKPGGLIQFMYFLFSWRFIFIKSKRN